jgi:hypothetical protein
MQQTPPGQTPPVPPNNSLIEKANELIKSFNKMAAEQLSNFTDTLAKLDRDLASGQAKIAGTMGQTQAALVGLREELTVALPGVAALGGSLTDVINLQQSVTKELATNVILLGETSQDLFTAGRAVGVASENVGGMVGAFQDAGISAGLVRDRIQETADVARSVGVNVSAVFNLVQSNLSRLNQFGFERGTEGLAKMAASSAAMRVDMSQVFNFAARVFSPESAIETVASLQRMGAAVGDLADPFRLMYLASEDVEELNRQVVNMTEQFSYFDEQTKEFKIFPNAKRDLREIEQATGIAYEDLVKMSIAQQKLNQITNDFRIRGISEEDKQFIANVSQYSKERGGFVVKIGKDEKLVTELNTTDLTQLKEASKAPATLEEIAQAQLDESQLLNATMQQFITSLAGPTAASKMFTDPREILRGGLVGIQTGITSSLGNQRQAQVDINKFVSELGDSLTDVLSGNLDFGKISGVLEKTFEGFSSGIDNITSSVQNVDFGEIFKKYTTSGNIIYEGAQKAVEGFDLLTQKITNLTSDSATMKKPDISSVSTSAKVEIADINYKGQVNVTLETPTGNAQNLTITDQMAYDLFQNPTFQKMNQMALQNAMSQSQYSTIPNRSMS